MYTEYDHYNSLCHFGILGMHWGVRRYQNEDGSYNSTGKKRYGKSKSLKTQALIGASVVGATALISRNPKIAVKGLSFAKKYSSKALKEASLKLPTVKKGAKITASILKKGTKSVYKTTKSVAPKVKTAYINGFKNAKSDFERELSTTKRQITNSRKYSNKGNKKRISIIDNAKREAKIIREDPKKYAVSTKTKINNSNIVKGASKEIKEAKQISKGSKYLRESPIKLTFDNFSYIPKKQKFTSNNRSGVNVKQSDIRNIQEKLLKQNEELLKSIRY